MADVATMKTLEGRLRPIYEWYEAIAVSLIAVITQLIAVPIGISPYIQKIMLIMSVGWACIRYIEGKKTRAYQKSLNTIDAFTITPGTIDHNSTETWIGRGFEFTSLHAQRVWDAEKKEYKKYYALPKRYGKARAYERETKQQLKK